MFDPGLLVVVNPTRTEPRPERSAETTAARAATDGGTETAPRTTVVVGVGPNLGSTVARRFASEGDQVGLVARSTGFLEDTAAELSRTTPGEAVAAPADVADPDQVATAFDRIRSAFGPVDVLVTTLYSTRTASGGVLDVDHEAFQGAWAVEAGGVFACAREAARDMVAGDGGTIVLTNDQSGRRAMGQAVARSSARFALRGLAEAMARDLRPDVHVAQVLIDGWPDKDHLHERYPDHPEDAWMGLEHMADAYHYLVDQPPDTRTFELDLRSSRDGLFGPWAAE